MPASTSAPGVAVRMFAAECWSRGVSLEDFGAGAGTVPEPPQVLAPISRFQLHEFRQFPRDAPPDVGCSATSAFSSKNKGEEIKTTLQLDDPDVVPDVEVIYDTAAISGLRQVLPLPDIVHQ